MAQKLFAPFRKIPSQVQNLPGINKIFDGKRVKLQKELFGFTEVRHIENHLILKLV